MSWEEARWVKTKVIKNFQSVYIWQKKYTFDSKEQVESLEGTHIYNFCFPVFLVKKFQDNIRRISLLINRYLKFKVNDTKI